MRSCLAICIVTLAIDRHMRVVLILMHTFRISVSKLRLNFSTNVTLLLLLLI